MMFISTTAASQNGPPVTGLQGEKGAATASYAVVKRPLQAITQREALTFVLPWPYPTRGVILVFGSFIGPGGSWTIVDFDARTIERVQTTTAVASDGNRKVTINSKVGRSLSVGEVNNIIKEANAIWDPPPPKPTSPGPPPTDSICDVALFDGPDVYHNYGPACPPETGPLVELIGAIGVSGG